MKDFLREGEEATEENPDDDLYPEISEIPVFNFLLEKLEENPDELGFRRHFNC